MTEKNKDRDRIVQLRGRGFSYNSIGKMVGLSKARIHQICSGYMPGRHIYLKKHIFERDNFRCQWGKMCEGKKIKVKDLVMHHIDFNDRNNNPKNLITLCKFCHGGFHFVNHIDQKTEEKLSFNKKGKQEGIIKKIEKTRMKTRMTNKKLNRNKLLKQIWENNKAEFSMQEIIDLLETKITLATFWRACQEKVEE